MMTDEELDEARAEEAKRIVYGPTQMIRIYEEDVRKIAAVGARLAREGWRPPAPLPTKASEIAERCGLCRFWVLSGYGEANGLESGAGGHHTDGSVSECRAAPPAPPGERTDRRLNGDGLWPTTRREDWCGAFVARSNPRCDTNPHAKTTA